MSRKKVNKKSVKAEKKKSKFKAIFILAIVLVIVALGIFFYTNRTEPSLALREYFSKLSNKEYEAMYDLVITDMSKEDFVSRIKNIYEGIETTSISIAITTNSTNEEDKELTNITYTNKIETMTGSESFINTAKVKQVDGKFYGIHL